MQENASKRTVGVLFILGAALCFALMNLFVNLAGDLPVMQKVFFRNLIASVAVFFLLLFQKEKFRIHSKECLFWLFLRSFVGFLGVILNFYAIDTIGSISDASILNKLSPFFAILFSVFLLKEKPRLYEIGFVALAFLGALFVVKPTFTAASLPALAGVLSGASAGFAYSCVRVLSVKGERGMMTVFFFSAFSTLVALPFFIAFYEPMTPFQLFALLMAGVSATGGQFFITAAYRFAPAKEIAVFDYSQVLFAAVLGFLFLDQLPDLWSLAGYGIIIGAAVGKQLLARRLAKRQSPSPEEQPGPPPPETGSPPDDAPAPPPEEPPTS
ncbi:MAG TPA: DMT family transporter [Candidatus Gallimonas intestinavium]|uniref:DMT family transporter n=1 Tax=Candidatus Gallimonas intestinavium TaxID=2838603 RepID=A0A9D2G7A0_9FIRM|nr:DMT family transporter [Candidatus Gallimonas intestinavium]